MDIDRRARIASAVILVGVFCTGCSNPIGGDDPDDGGVGPGDPDATVVNPGDPDAAVVNPGDPDAAVVNPGDPDAAVVNPGDPDANTTTPDDPPTWASELASSDQWERVTRGEGTVDFGVAAVDAPDNAVARLVFPGDPNLGPADRAGPGFSSEILTDRRFTYGRFRMRLSLASCTAAEDLVNGIFLYFNDGSDLDHDGIADNPEIDIEILCSDPSIIVLSSWTDYSGATGEFRKWSYAVDLDSGELSQSPSDHEYGLVPVGTDPQLRHPGFPSRDAFYEMGFDWHADRLRFFIVLDGVEKTLWTLTDTRYIPSREMLLMFNVWHPPTHWFGPPAPADYPAQDGVMRLDWARYWAD